MYSLGGQGWMQGIFYHTLAYFHDKEFLTEPSTKLLISKP